MFGLVLVSCRLQHLQCEHWSNVMRLTIGLKLLLGMCEDTYTTTWSMAIAGDGKR